jgi:Predicted pPIWI-associating nuclease
MNSVATLLENVEQVAKTIRTAPGTQIRSRSTKADLHKLATDYFDNVQAIAAQSPNISESLDRIFHDIHAVSRINPSKSRCSALLKQAKRTLVECEGLAISQSSKIQAGHRTRADELVVSSLNDICPSAAFAYQQALLDFDQPSRLSWRGPATDLRESLRETLDVLAPDKEVESMPGYKLEPDAKRPTMKQKVRYILKSRGIPSGAIATPEIAVVGIEEIIGGLTRSVYNRSSVSTHTSTDRSEVVRVHAWVRMVLCELLEIPL